MRYLCLLPLLLTACGITAQAHVERAIEAQGGLDAMRAVQNFHVSAEGAFARMAYTVTQHSRRSGDWRYDMTFAGGEGMPGGTRALWVLGPDANVYASEGGPALVQEGESRANSIGHARASTAVTLPDTLLGTDVTLQLGEPIEIEGRTHKVVVANFGHGTRPVTYAFDPDTKRISRLSFTMFDMASLQLTDAYIDLTDWKQVEDLWIPHKALMDFGGAKGTEEVTEVRINRTLEENLLAAPEIGEPPTIGVREEAEAMVAVHKFVGQLGQVGEAIGKVMAWIGSLGGQPAGPVTTLYKKPMNMAEFDKNETIIHVPVQMEKAAKSDDMRVAKRGAFLFAYMTYEGSPMNAMHRFGEVYTWCQKNGYRRTGPRMLRTLEMNAETGQAKVEVGFPVKRKANW